MFCENCGTKIEEGAQFCQNCGKSTSVGAKSAVASIDPKNVKLELGATIKCGNCEYIGSPEKARSPFFVVLAWICVVFAPLITIIYFVATHKYRCPKCKSTFLGLKNKEGAFVAQRGSNALGIFLIILVGIAIIGILSSVVLASLNSAREKARQAQESSLELNR